MKIISIRRGFASDHSSTSYEFLAIDRPLDKEDRAAVASLSSRARPTRHSVSFIYHADGYDIPGGWEPLMRNYYDVMWSESYDWWQLVMAFPLVPQQQEQLMKYCFDGVDDLGVDVSVYGERAIVTINCRLESFGPYDDFGIFDDDNAAVELDVETDDTLLHLLAKIRQQLMEGDYRALYEVWLKYGYGDDEEDEDDEEEWPVPPVPAEKKTGEKIVAAFAEMLILI